MTGSHSPGELLAWPLFPPGNKPRHLDVAPAPIGLWMCLVSLGNKNEHRGQGAGLASRGVAWAVGRTPHSEVLRACLEILSRVPTRGHVSIPHSHLLALWGSLVGGPKAPRPRGEQERKPGKGISVPGPKERRISLTDESRGASCPRQPHCSGALGEGRGLKEGLCPRLIITRMPALVLAIFRVCNQPPCDSLRAEPG